MKFKDLKKYISSFDDEQEVTCDFINDLKNTIKQEHFVCEICGKAVIGKSGLANHKRFKHKVGD